MNTRSVGAGPVRRPLTGRLLLAGLALLPVLEIAAAVAVARWVGVGWTLVALAALTVAGVVVLRRAGRAAVRTLGPRTVSSEPVVPAGASKATGADLALEAAGGVLLVVPGFVTALVGALLVVPPVRRVVRPLLGAGAMRVVTSAARRGRVRVVTGETVTGQTGTAETVDVRVTRVADLGEPVDVGPRAVVGEVVDPAPRPPVG
jgi:UPF0716 protein FxsA